MSTAAPAFDPYREWLGIEPHEQPADFYRLLGVARFETDQARIAAAADQRMALVRSFQVGPRGVYTQRLLNELSAARIALLSPSSKAAYDTALSQHMAASIAPLAAPSPNYAAPAVLTFGLGQTLVMPAPPVLPPAVPPPAAPRISSESQADEAPPESARPAPWWREILLLVGVPVLVLAAVIGWGFSRPYFGQAISDPTGETAPSADTGRAPEPPPKPTPTPIVLLQEGSGQIVFSAATATRSGVVELQVVGTEEVLTRWTGPNDSVQWRFKLVKPGFFQAEIVYATAPTAGDAAIELVIDEQPKTFDLRTSGGLDRFITDTVTLLVPTNGEQTLVIRPARKPEGDWFVLKSVRLIPVDREKPATEPTPEP